MGHFIGRVSPKGQLTIPSQARKEIGLEPGRIVRIETANGAAIITPKKQGARGLKGLVPKSPHPIDDDFEIMESIWEKTRPGTGPRGE